MRNAIIFASMLSPSSSLLNQEVCGERMIDRVVRNCESCDVTQTVIIGDHDQIMTNKAPIMQWSERIASLKQETVLCVDAHLALLSHATLQSMFDLSEQADVILLTGKWPSDAVGCVVRDSHGDIKAIGEKVGLSEYIYPVCVVKDHLLGHLCEDFAQSLKRLVGLTQSIKVVTLKQPQEALYVKNALLLAEANQICQQQINEYWMKQGVILVDPKQTYISVDSQIKEGTVIYPQVTVKQSVLGKRCIITSGCWLENAEIGDFCKIESSKIIDSKVGEQSEVGPFAHFRGKSEVGSHCRIGNFVEFKKTIFGNGSKCAHLTYLGDAIVGEKVNIGCGVVTVNYDGKNKHQTLIGDGAFIGSNVNLIAPITVGQQAVVAAGSTVSASVESEDLVIERSSVVVKQGYGIRYLSKK